MSKRVLCFLKSSALYGKERSNIEVYNLLKDQGGFQLKVIVNEDSSYDLKNYLNGFDTVPLAFPDRSIAKYKYIKYIIGSIRLNINVVFLLLKFRPHYIFINDEKLFYDIGFPIYLFGNKVVFRIGDEPAFPDLSYYRFNSWFWKHIILGKTDTFVYISDFIRRKVKVTGRDSSKDVVIYNYPPRRKNSDESEQGRYVDAKGTIIGFIGQVFHDKGVHLFVESAIELAKIHKKLTFYIAGSLTHNVEYANELVAVVNNSHLEDRIIFLGNIDNVRTFFDTIDILVTPSLKEEPLGNVIVEAKKYATPCIIFNSGGMPELIDHKVNGYICDSSTSRSITMGINYYLEDKNLINLHGQNAKASIEQLKIDYPNFKSKWLEVFAD